MCGLFKFKTYLILALVLLLCIPFKANSEVVRLKDIATFSGVRTNPLIGYGLVVGLSGTGDRRGAEFTIQSIVNMLEHMGIKVDRRNIQPKNVAAVVVTAELPASAKPGTRLDVTVSSIGDAESLLGGVLLLTPLKGIDGKVYALAQGPIIIGGYSVKGAGGTVTKNFTTVGKIPGGAIVERSVPFDFNSQDKVVINLDIRDFSTTNKIVNLLNSRLNGNYAYAKDISTIIVKVPDQFKHNLVPFMALIENLEIQPDMRAKVVVDEKTGTIVLGSNVRLSPVAVAQGSLSVVVKEEPQVSQPAPFGLGVTTVVPRTTIKTKEEKRNIIMLKGPTLKDLVKGLNAIGATPRDIISILRALKAAGALHAELEVY